MWAANQSVVSLPVEGGWNEMISKVSPSPNHSSELGIHPAPCSTELFLSTLMLCDMLQQKPAWYELNVKGFFISAFQKSWECDPSQQ